MIKPAPTPRGLRASRIRRSLGGYSPNTDGAAAMEMAVWATILVVAMLNVTDVGIYAYQRMEVENSAQMAAQAAWQVCTTSAQLPAVKNCTSPDMFTVMTKAAQSTTLGTSVTIARADVTEGYYCTNSSSGNLEVNGNTGTLDGAVAPTYTTNCSGSIVPGDYLQVTASKPYNPLFSAGSIGNFLPRTISRQAWIRLS